MYLGKHQPGEPVWRLHHMYLRKTPLGYADAETGYWVPLAKLPPWVVPQIGAVAIARAGWVDARGKQQKAGNHSYLLHALRGHAKTYDLNMVTMLDDVVPDQHRRKLFERNTVDIFHATGSGQFERAATIGILNKAYRDNLECIQLAIEASTRQHGNWAISVPLGNLYVVRGTRGIRQDRDFAGVRTTQRGDLLILNGHLPYVLTDSGPVEVTQDSAVELGLDHDFVKEAIGKSLFSLYTERMRAAQLVAAICTLAGISGADSGEAIALLDEYLAKRSISQVAVKKLIETYQAPGPRDVTEKEAVNQAMFQTRIMARTWGSASPAAPLQAALRKMYKSTMEAPQ